MRFDQEKEPTAFSHRLRFHLLERRVKCNQIYPRKVLTHLKLSIHLIFSNENRLIGEGHTSRQETLISTKTKLAFHLTIVANSLVKTRNKSPASRCHR